jgi:hypothetical protein
MLLICEKIDDVHTLTETTESGVKKYYIEGTMLQSAIKNKNGRMYPEAVMDKEVARYTKSLIEQRRAYGELNHPPGPTINLDRVSHIIKELRKDGPNYIGKALVLETPMGKIVQNLIDAEANLGVSSRGVGSLKPNKAGIMEVQDDFMLATAADIVADPSAPDAFVKGIMEGAQWMWDIAEGSWKQIQVLENIQTELKNSTVKAINENKIKMFDKFLRSL